MQINPDLFQKQAVPFQAITQGPEFKKFLRYLIGIVIVIAIIVSLYLFASHTLDYTADNDGFEAAAQCVGFSVSQRKESPQKRQSKATFGRCVVTFDMYNDKLDAAKAYLVDLGFKDTSNVRVFNKAGRSSAQYYANIENVVFIANYNQTEECKEMTKNLAFLTGYHTIVRDSPIIDAVKRAMLIRELCPAEEQGAE